MCVCVCGTLARFRVFLCTQCVLNAQVAYAKKQTGRNSPYSMGLGEGGELGVHILLHSASAAAPDAHETLLQMTASRACAHSTRVHGLPFEAGCRVFRDGESRQFGL